MSEHTPESGYTDPRCGCTDAEGIHAVTCDFWPEYVKPPAQRHQVDWYGFLGGVLLGIGLTIMFVSAVKGWPS